MTCLPVGGLEAGQERVDVDVGQLLGPVHLVRRDVSNVVRLCRDTVDRCQARQPVGELERQHDQRHQVHAMRHAGCPAGL